MCVTPDSELHAVVLSRQEIHHVAGRPHHEVSIVSDSQLRYNRLRTIYGIIHFSLKPSASIVIPEQLSITVPGPFRLSARCPEL